VIALFGAVTLDALTAASPAPIGCESLERANALAGCRLASRPTVGFE
jgi:hypothetical protein